MAGGRREDATFQPRNILLAPIPSTANQRCHAVEPASSRNQLDRGRRGVFSFTQMIPKGRPDARMDAHTPRNSSVLSERCPDDAPRADPCLPHARHHPAHHQTIIGLKVGLILVGLATEPFRFSTNQLIVYSKWVKDGLQCSVRGCVDMRGLVGRSFIVM